MSNGYVPLTVHSISESMRRRNPALFGPQDKPQPQKQTKPDPAQGEGPNRSEKAAKTQKRGRKDVALPKPPTPNATERRYYDEVLLPRIRSSELATVKYEAVTLNMLNGHKYTCDWCCWTPEGTQEIHEVKGSYKLGSYQRAKLAFDQCRVEFPQIKFYWGEEK